MQIAFDYNLHKTSCAEVGDSGIDFNATAMEKKYVLCITNTPMSKEDLLLLGDFAMTDCFGDYPDIPYIWNENKTLSPLTNKKANKVELLSEIQKNKDVINHANDPAAKYKLTGDIYVRHPDYDSDGNIFWEPTKGYIVHRIEALKDFAGVKKGDKGGYVERKKPIPRR